MVSPLGHSGGGGGAGGGGGPHVMSALKGPFDRVTEPSVVKRMSISLPEA